MRRVLMLLLATAVPGLPLAATAGDAPVVELSLEEAVTRALENSPDVRVERLGNESTHLAVDELTRSYEPLLVSQLQIGSKLEPAQDAFTGGAEVSTRTATWDFGVEQPLRSGGLVRLDMLDTRLGSDSVYATFNPGYATNLQLSLTQPLLRNLGIDERRQRIRVAKKNREISDMAFRECVLNTTAEVKRRYFDLLLASGVVDAYQHVLTLTEKLQEDNRERVEGGILPRSDLLLGDSELAARRGDLLSAQAKLKHAEDALKRLILPKDAPAAWNARLRPTDDPPVEAVKVDLDAALRRALEKRTDLRAARASLERSDVARAFAQNQALPSVDLSATYGTLGVGGTQLVRDDLGGDVLKTIPGGYGDAISDALARRYPTWTVGLSISYPILNRSARVGLARARVGHEQAEAQVDQLEREVILEVRDAALAVETDYGRLQQATKAYDLGKERLDAEMARLESGMSSPFFVVQAQRDLTVAQLTMLNIVADYRKSVVSFERVQEAGLSSDGFLTP
jgi:outer membrane protein